jgi:hypothetical protein
MQDGFDTEVAETSMTMHNLYPFPYDDIPEYGEEGEYGRERGLAIYDPKRHVVDLEAIGEVSDASSASVGVRYDYDLVTAVYEFLECVLVCVLRELPMHLQMTAGIYGFPPLLCVMSILLVGKPTRSIPGCGKKKSLTILYLVSPFAVDVAVWCITHAILYGILMARECYLLYRSA